MTHVGTAGFRKNRTDLCGSDVLVLNRWARPAADLKWCLVVEISRGSMVTACVGRWARNETHQTATNPPPADRCGACSVAWVERGLAELAAAPVTTQPAPALAFYLSEGNG